jgi:hypothetical protein
MRCAWLFHWDGNQTPEAQREPVGVCGSLRVISSHIIVSFLSVGMDSRGPSRA